MFVKLLLRRGGGLASCAPAALRPLLPITQKRRPLPQFCCVVSAAPWPSPVKNFPRRGLAAAAATAAALTVARAHSLLELPEQFSARDLRQAYFVASKRLHPDVSTLDKASATTLFLEMTEAYELLQEMVVAAKAHTDAGGDMKDFKHERAQQQGDMEDLLMSEDEEAAWREMCQMWVGASAELVEELKADPAWRLWLMGDTDGAGHWRTFLLNNGGLMPIYLRSSQHQLSGKRQLRLGKKPRRKRK